MKFSQVPHTVLMVRPARFGYNQETAASNAFQKRAENEDLVQAKALQEFDAAITIMQQHGIDTEVVEDTPVPVTTDAIFPNNWISTHQDGRIILYPMMAPSRRKERRADIVDLLRSKYNVKEVVDLTSSEEVGAFLEGTGSIIFDHINQIAYACKSARTNEKLLDSLCEKINYKSILFEAVDENGLPIYHTNVMMWIGEKLAGVCLDSIHSENDLERILDSFSQTGHKLIALSYEQMKSFAGNMFEVANSADDRFLLMSQTAFRSLLPGQLHEIEKYATPLPLEISTIEESGGGSIRCMVAGIHLPSR